jgi:hypothetical protein
VQNFEFSDDKKFVKIFEVCTKVASGKKETKNGTSPKISVCSRMTGTMILFFNYAKMFFKKGTPLGQHQFLN